MAGEIETWWKGVPPITKFLFAGSFAITIAANYGLVPVSYLILDFSKIFKSLEVWRFVTAFLFHGKLGFNFLMHMVFLVRFGAQLERDTFRGDTADFLFFVLFGGLLLLVIGFFMNFYILGSSLIMMIIYLWSRSFPNNVMSFMFGLRFESKYLPYVLIGFDLLLHGFPMPEIVGLIVGHTFYYLHSFWPEHGGPRILRTPQFLKDMFPNQQNIPRRGEGPRQAGYDWGRGQRVGGD